MMKFRRLFSVSKILPLAMLAGFGGAIQAQEFYAGLGIGSSDFDANQFGASNSAWTAQLGAAFGPLLAIELAYSDYQRFDSRVAGQILPHPKALSMSGIVKYPLLNRLDVFAKLGYARIATDISSSNPFYNVSRDENNAVYGGGFDYRLASKWSLRLAYERVELNLGLIPSGSFYSHSEGGLELASIGLLRKF
jgi:opacity protein-like surface antigen